MKILILHSRYRSAAPSGENVVVDAEAALLRDAGHEVMVWQRHSDDIAAWSLPRKAMLPALSIRNPEVRRSLLDLLRREQPDVVHVHNTFPMLSPSVLEACATAKVPVVATLHNYKLLCASGDFFRDGAPCHECADGQIRPAVAHGCYRGSRIATVPIAAGIVVNRASWRDLVSAYVFISASQRDILAGLGLPAQRSFVKHNFVAPRPTSERREHRVTYLGRLDAAKGVPVLMRAWDRFRSSRPTSTLRLAIAGGGVLADEVARWAAGHDTVDLHAHLDRADAGALLARSLAVVIPSAWEETFGLVAVEAMAAGVAPIAPARGSFPELIRHGVDGVLYSPGDPDELALQIEDLSDDPARCRALGAAGAVAYRERFTPDVSLRRLEEIYAFARRHPACGGMPHHPTIDLEAAR